MSFMIDRANDVEVTAEDMQQAQLAMEEQPGGGRAFEVTVARLAQIFPNDPDRVLAIIFRMQALGRLIEASRPGWWFLPQQADGAVPVSDIALRVAAELPLIDRDGDVAFCEAHFLQRALHFASTDGEG